MAGTTWKTLDGRKRLYGDEGATVYSVEPDERGNWRALRGDELLGTRNARGTAMRLCEGQYNLDCRRAYDEKWSREQRIIVEWPAIRKAIETVLASPKPEVYGPLNDARSALVEALARIDGKTTKEG
jgi:hypothetical protein